VTDKLSFSIPGVPVAKGRARATARIVLGNPGDEPRAIVAMHTPAETIAAERAVRAEFARRFPRHVKWTGTVMLRFTAVFPIPKSYSLKLREACLRGAVYHTQKPDKDNIEKLISDALNGLAWHDDGQVQGGGIKRFGEPARLDVTIEHIPAPDVPATPSEKRRIARDAQPELVFARPARKQNPTKSHLPERLQRAVDEAEARDARKRARRHARPAGRNDGVS
jgi:Holliday junction resolvase RusA-like endonuclease